jgi:hypothetical protein
VFLQQSGSTTQTISTGSLVTLTTRFTGGTYYSTGTAVTSPSLGNLCTTTNGVFLLTTSMTVSSAGVTNLLCAISENSATTPLWGVENVATNFGASGGTFLPANSSTCFTPVIKASSASPTVSVGTTNIVDHIAVAVAPPTASFFGYYFNPSASPVTISGSTTNLGTNVFGTALPFQVGSGVFVQPPTPSPAAGYIQTPTAAGLAFLFTFTLPWTNAAGVFVQAYIVDQNTNRYCITQSAALNAIVSTLCLIPGNNNFKYNLQVWSTGGTSAIATGNAYFAAATTVGDYAALHGFGSAQVATVNVPLLIVSGVSPFTNSGVVSYSAGWFTVSAAGLYLVSVSNVGVTQGFSPASKNFAAWFVVNSTTTSQQYGYVSYQRPTSSPSFSSVSLSATLELAATSKVGLVLESFDTNTEFSFGQNNNGDMFVMRLSPFVATSSPSQSPTPPTPPTRSPSLSPSRTPSHAPSRSPSKAPSKSPSRSPTRRPSRSPSRSPTRHPSRSPSKSPSGAPSSSPTTTPPYTPIVYVTETPISANFGASGGCRVGANAVCESDPSFVSLGCNYAYMVVGCASDPLPLSDPQAPGSLKPISTVDPVTGTTGALLAQNWTEFWSAPLQTNLAEGLLNVTTRYVFSGLEPNTTPAPASVTCEDWTSTLGSASGSVGDTMLLNTWWSTPALTMCASRLQAVCVCLRRTAPEVCTRFIV